MVALIDLLHFLLQKGDSDSFEHEKSSINPWSISIINDLLRKMHSEISKYNVSGQYYLLDIIFDTIVDYVLLILFSPLIYTFLLQAFLTLVLGIPFKHKTLFRKSGLVVSAKISKE